MNLQEKIDFLRDAWKKIAWNQPEHSCLIGFDAVIGRYQQAGRHYHDLRHLVECLEHPEIDKAHNPSAVRLALFFHDYVYSTQRPDMKENEKNSADVLSLYIAPYLRSPRDAYIACKHVIATGSRESSDPDPSIDGDSKLVIDCDLSVLGSSSDRYAQYECDIRLEYFQYPKELYEGVRRTIMQGIANRPNIFSNESFRMRYEEQAKKNIAVYWR